MGRVRGVLRVLWPLGIPEGAGAQQLCPQAHWAGAQGCCLSGGLVTDEDAVFSIRHLGFHNQGTGRLTCQGFEILQRLLGLNGERGVFGQGWSEENRRLASPQRGQEERGLGLSRQACGEMGNQLRGSGGFSRTEGSLVCLRKVRAKSGKRV